MQHYSTQPNVTTQIQFRHMPKMDDLQNSALQYRNNLSGLIQGDSRCEIVFDRSQSSREGRIFEVTIRLYIPGHRLYVARHTEKDLPFTALNIAFHDIQRQMVKARAKRPRRIQETVN